MKRWFKIVLITSLVINVAFVVIQIVGYYNIRMNWEWNAKSKYENFTKMVNAPEVKKHFMDSLFKKYPELKTKKYLFINFWDTGDTYTLKQIPILDTLIKPILPDVGYVFVNDEAPDYSVRILKRNKISSANFLFINQAGDFIQAINQEIRVPRRRFGYPKCSMNLILDKAGKIIYFDTLQTYSGPRWPEDSLKDKIFVHQLNKAFSDLK